MDKIWIILKSEYWRRVRSKWFIFTTLLAPLFLVGITTLPAAFAVLGGQQSELVIAVGDETKVLFPRLQDLADDAFILFSTQEPPVAMQDAVRGGTYDGYLHLPADLLPGGEATYYSARGGGLSLPGRLERLVERAVEQQRLEVEQVPPAVLDIINARVPVRMVTLTEEGEEVDHSIAYSIVGWIMGFFIYVTVLIYGAFVMQGVIEEKNSRVVEVMVSSVRPFQLLMGKVLGIGAMGLTQMITWSLLAAGLMLSAGSIAALFLDPSSFNLPADASQEAMLAAADISLPALQPSLFVWFVLFFLGGYLLYASLYAAIGSAVDQPQDAQALSAPLTMVVILPILFITFVVESPDSTLSLVLSLIPFFSPILMVVRVAVTEVPFWQVGLSYLLLVGGFIGSIWVSSRIYRIGILMYGKKPRLKDLIRWFRYA